jgi:hypothetical protein
MRFRLEDGFREIEIVARRDLVEFHSEELAAAFFRRLLREPANRIAMRRSLAGELGGADLFRRSDEEVACWLARKVVFGDLRILAQDLPQRPVPGGEREATPREVEQAAQAEQSASPQPAPAAPAEEEADPLLAGTDQAAQAATLQAAAESGAPLCDT